MARTVTDVSVEGVQKRTIPKKHIVYAIKVTWSDGTVNVIYRTYKQFQILEEHLLNVFSDEALGKNGKPRSIPRLQGKDPPLTLKSNPRRKWKWIDDFSMNLVELPCAISECNIVEEFFTPKPEDLINSKRRKMEEKQEKAKKKKRRRRSYWRRQSTIINISGPVAVEEYRVLEDYKQLYEKDIDLTAGDTVNVVKKRDDGWWMVNSNGETGWAPASYLEPLDGTQENRDTEEVKVGEGEMYVSVKPYKGLEEDELNFPVGVNLQVIRKNLDGWWTAVYMGKEGFVPAVFLKPLSEKKPSSKSRKRFSVSRITLKHNRRGSQRSLLLAREKRGHIVDSVQNQNPVRRIKRVVSFEDELEIDKLSEEEINFSKVTNKNQPKDVTDTDEDKHNYKRLLFETSSEETEREDDPAENGDYDDYEHDHESADHGEPNYKLPREDFSAGDTLQKASFTAILDVQQLEQPEIKVKLKTFPVLFSSSVDRESQTFSRTNERGALPDTEVSGYFSFSSRSQTLTEEDRTVWQDHQIGHVPPSSQLPCAYDKEQASIWSNLKTCMLQTEHELHRCYSEPTRPTSNRQMLDENPNLSLVDKSVTANSLPRSATVSMERKKQHHKQWEPQDSKDLNEGNENTTKSQCLNSRVLTHSTHEERLRTPIYDTSEEKKRTRGSISKLVVSPKLLEAQMDSGKDRLQKQGSEIMHSYEDLRNTEQQVLNGNGNKTRQCFLSSVSFDNYEDLDGCESPGLQSDTSRDSGIFTGGSPSTFSPPILLSNNNTCLLHPSCPEDNCNWFVFQPLTYFAIASYKAQGALEVSFYEGEEVKVLRKASNGWWMVKVGGEKGWAPSNYFEEGPSNFHRVASPEYDQDCNENIFGPNPSSEGSDEANNNDTRADLRGSSKNDTVQVKGHSKDGYLLVRIPSKYVWVPSERVAASQE